MHSFAPNLLQLVGLFSAFASTAQAKQTNDICSLVDAQFPGLVGSSYDNIFNASQTGFYTSFERDLIPGCVFRPTSTADVSEFVKLVAKRGQRYANGTYQPQFAVRTGGHTLWAGAANINGGVTVDMRSLDTLVISKDKKTASIGGGSIFSNLYSQLVQHNLTVLGGRVPGIGAGGFVTGGGVNFLARRHGFSCDNVYGYEVVLASGDVVYASATSNRDLWLALKGGSNNFGIITRFDLEAFPQGNMLGGVIAFNYTESVLAAQAEAFANFMEPKNFDDAAMMGLILGYGNSTGFSVSNSLFYVEPVASPSVYKPFTSIPSTGNTLGLRNVADTVTSFGQDLPTNINRATELVYSFKNGNATVYSELIQIFEDRITALSNIEGLIVQFLIQPHPVTNGTNSLGLTAGETDLVMCDVTVAYNNAADDKVVQEKLEILVNAQTKALSDKGLLIPFTYLNYADVSQDPIGSYGQANKKQLQAVSKKYDPNGLFQKAAPGGYKLF